MNDAGNGGMSHVSWPLQARVITIAAEFNRASRVSKTARPAGDTRMLNYIWAGLIIFSFVFATVSDVGDLRRDTYRNGQSLPITLQGATTQPTQAVKVVIDPATYQAFYKVSETPAASYDATLVQRSGGERELRFASSASLPPRLAKIRDMTSADDPKWLLAAVTDFQPLDNGTAAATIRFEHVRWVA